MTFKLISDLLDPFCIAFVITAGFHHFAVTALFLFLTVSFVLTNTDLFCKFACVCCFV